MFVPNILTLCDEKQIKEWLPLCSTSSVIGCYAQTELGHGSNIRALQTTATYDITDDTFVINSPTMVSAKFWPGSLGKTANHAMVIARLIDGDKIDRGIHNFIVQVRCFNRHFPMKGIKLGDIGSSKYIFYVCFILKEKGQLIRVRLSMADENENVHRELTTGTAKCLTAKCLAAQKPRFQNKNDLIHCETGSCSSRLSGASIAMCDI